jgi:spore maturation protein CgeB
MVQGARFYEYNIEKIPYKFVTHIGFIGSLKGKIYSSRRELLAKICEKFGNKYIIRIWGVKPDKRENFYSILNSFHTGRRIFFEEFKKAVMGSKIIVDIGSEESIREEGALSGKVFMITGCGGFLMIKYIKGVEEFFEIGKEIEIFNEHEEAFDKINYYLKNEEKRRKIAENARKRVLREHLYIHRLKKIFEICGI